MNLLWQGSGEKTWRFGQLVCHDEMEDLWEQQFDFIWTDDDDPRRLFDCDHADKLELYGPKEELARLSIHLLEFLNAIRTDKQRLRSTNSSASQSS